MSYQPSRYVLAQRALANCKLSVAIYPYQRGRAGGHLIMLKRDKVVIEVVNVSDIPETHRL